MQDQAAPPTPSRSTSGGGHHCSIDSQPLVPPRDEQQPSPLAQLAKTALLFKRCRVELQDGRVLTGDFHCMDREGNVILSNTHVHHSGAAAGLDDRRMGLVLVPPSHVVSMAVEAMPREVESLKELLTYDGEE